MSHGSVDQNILSSNKERLVLIFGGGGGGEGRGIFITTIFFLFVSR